MITFLLPQKDYDPTEAGVVWQALVNSGYKVQFATPGGKVGHADRRLTQTGFGFLSPILMTRKPALQCYKNMKMSVAFQNPLSYSEVNVHTSEGIFIPGGHAPGMKTLLESNIAQNIMVKAFDVNLPVGCVCHGVLLLARSIVPATGKSVLFGRQTTALVKTMELSAWAMTFLWLKNYYRTYKMTVQSEVKKALASPKDFKSGPLLPFRDSEKNLKPGFTVRDDNYVSARWPGDCYALAQEFVCLLKLNEQQMALNSDADELQDIT